MKKIDQRTTIFIFIGISLAAMLILAISISTLKLAPGQKVPLDQLFPKFTLENTAPVTDTTLIEQILKIFSIIVWAVLPIYIIYLILSPAARKQFVKDMARLLPIMLILFFFLNNMQQTQKTIENPITNLSPDQLKNALTSSAPADLKFNTGASEWIVTATSIALAVGITLVLVGIVYFVYRERKRRADEEQPLKKMALQAQSAIDAIQLGADLRDVIIRCYLEMTKIVAESRNLQRESAMTPHEFEMYLGDKGLPGEPVHQLTQIFELVRYGGMRPTMQDERTALASLTAIVNTCRRAA